MNEYLEKAKEFLKLTNTNISIEYLRNDINPSFGDKEKRDIYNVIISRGNRKIEFEFTNSLVDSFFGYTQGVQRKEIDRKYLSKSKSELVNIIKKQYSFSFNPIIDKIIYATPPNEYDILACLTTNDPETFEDFCDEFGYKKATKIYDAVCEEWSNVQIIWNDAEIELLQEIN